MTLAYGQAIPRKNLFPRRPVVHRRDIEILTSNVIKMLACFAEGERDFDGKKKIDFRVRGESECIWQARMSHKNGSWYRHE